MADNLVIQVREDLRVEDIPMKDVFRGRSIALAYSSKGFVGAGIYLTPDDAVKLANALLSKAESRDG